MKKIFAGFLLAGACLAAPAVAGAQTVNEVLARFDNEPSAEATIQAAMDYSGIQSDRLESMYTRAGAANALPKSISYEMDYRDYDKDRPQTVYTYSDDNEDAWASKKSTKYQENMNQMDHKFKVQWDLSRVVFNSDQLRVVSAMNTAANSRDKILKAVAKVYFDRRRAQIDMVLNPPADVQTQLSATLKIDEFTATLDAMTGGWFSKNIKR